MLVQNFIHVEIHNRGIDGHARFCQSSNQIHRVFIAGLQVAVGIGIGGVSRQAEEDDLVGFVQREDGVVILHDDGAFLALSDGQGFGGSHHVLDGGIVFLETGCFLVIDGDIAGCTQHAVDLAAVAIGQARAQAGEHKQARHQGRQSAQEGRCFGRFHTLLHPFFD